MTGNTRHPDRHIALRFSSLGAIAVLVAGVLLGLPALATAWGEPDLGRVVNRLPADIDFVIALDNGADLRRELDVDPLADWVLARPPIEGLSDAWAALADDIGMDDIDAFDHLLGRRVIFAATGLNPGEEAQWALLSELDDATERRLRDRLKAKPRGIVAGQSVLELENGAFLMATSAGALRCSQTEIPVSLQSPSVLLLAPSTNRDMFASLLPLLRCESAPIPLAGTPGGRALNRLESEQCVFLWAVGGANAPDSRFVTGTLGRAEGFWGMKLLAGNAPAWMPDLAQRPVRAWSPSVLFSLPGDPILALVGQRSIVDDARALISVVHPEALGGRDADEIDRLLGELSMVALWDEHKSGGDAPEVLIATEARDLLALQPRGDALLNRSIRGIKQPDLQAIQRLASEEVRSVEVPTLPTARRRHTAGKVNWMYLPKSDPKLANEGWWVVHFDPNDSSEKVEREFNERVDTGALKDPTARRYLHVGRARPLELLGMLDSTPAALALSQPATQRAVSQLALGVERVHWSVWHDDTYNEIVARVLIQPAATAGR